MLTEGGIIMPKQSKNTEPAGREAYYSYPDPKPSRRKTERQPKRSSIFAYRWGYGFIREAPQRAQREKLASLSNCIGLAVVVYILIEIVSVYLLPGLLGSLGVNLRFDGFSQKIYGGRVECAAFALLSSMLKFAAAATVLFSDRGFRHRTKRHFKVQSDKALVPLEFFTALALSAASQMFVVLITKLIPSLEIITYQDNSVRYFGDNGRLITAALYSVVVIPVLTELLVHGALLFSLKGFGNNFAIFISAIAAVILEHNHQTALFTLATAMVFGYFAIITGSVFVPMLMHVGYSGMSFLIWLINVFISEPYSRLFTYSFVLTAAVISLLMISIFLCRRRIQKTATDNSIFRLRDMVTIFMTSPLLLLAVGVSFMMFLT